jgi:hypothetical protein
MVLCSRCTGTDLGTLIEHGCTEAVAGPNGHSSNYRMIEGLSLAALTKAAIQGCDLCSLIHHEVLDKTSKKVACEQVTDNTLISVSLLFEKCHANLAPNPAQCDALQIECWTGGRETCHRIKLTLAAEGNGQHISQKRSAWDPSLWRSWMDDCLKTHEACSAFKHNGYTPTRLVDVGLVDTLPNLIESYG